MSPQKHSGKPEEGHGVGSGVGRFGRGRNQNLGRDWVVSESGKNGRGQTLKTLRYDSQDLVSSPGQYPLRPSWGLTVD